MMAPASGLTGLRMTKKERPAVADIHAIKQAMERRPPARVAISAARAAAAVNAETNRARLIVIRAPESPELGISLAVGKSGTAVSTGNGVDEKWRRGWDSNPRRGKK